jgi:hypothetical protein
MDLGVNLILFHLLREVIIELTTVYHPLSREDIDRIIDLDIDGIDQRKVLSDRLFNLGVELTRDIITVKGGSDPDFYAVFSYREERKVLKIREKILFSDRICDMLESTPKRREIKSVRHIREKYRNHHFDRYTIHIFFTLFISFGSKVKRKKILDRDFLNTFFERKK